MRIFAFLFLILSTFLFPWQAVVSLFVFFSALFPKFWEGLLAGVFMDAFYFSPLLFDKAHLGFFTLSFTAAFLLMQWAAYIIQGRNFLSKMVVAGAGAIFLSAFILVFS